MEKPKRSHPIIQNFFCRRGETQTSHHIQCNAFETCIFKSTCSALIASVGYRERKATFIILSQNHLGWKRPLRSCSPTFQVVCRRECEIDIPGMGVTVYLLSVKALCYENRDMGPLPVLRTVQTTETALK